MPARNRSAKPRPARTTSVECNRRHARRPHGASSAPPVEAIVAAVADEAAKVSEVVRGSVHSDDNAIVALERALAQCRALTGQVEHALLSLAWDRNTADRR
jgi:hypothetical protein